MKIFVLLLVVPLMLATLGVLFAGLIGFARGGGGRSANKFMRWRVMLQAAALLVLAAIASLAR
jgi:hypothetical protein